MKIPIINMFLESFKGSTGKFDHKRLTVFAFVLLFILITIVSLFKSEEIPNRVLMESILITINLVILGSMGLTKINNKTINKKLKEDTENADQ